MIRSYRGKTTVAIHRGQRARRVPPDVAKRTRMRLNRIDAAVALDDLRVPPSHRLEKLSGHRAGQWSIRVNDQWRICFEWRDGHAHNVEFTDYH